MEEKRWKETNRNGNRENERKDQNTREKEKKKNGRYVELADKQKKGKENTKDENRGAKKILEEK